VLCEAAEEVLRQRARLCGAPIPLLANSFGTMLAFDLLNRVPEHIASITISGGTLDPKSAFIRIARRLSISRAVEHLSDLADAAEQSASFDVLRTLIVAVLELPNLWAEYWTRSAVDQQSVMGDLAMSGKLLDIATFWCVMEDFVRHPPRFTTPLPACGGRVLVGAADPFAAPDETAAWTRWLLGASVQVVPAGHFPHLELPIESWLPTIF
jgi:pimeloyl-ACP methyl ester carboxylesterase